MAVRLNPCDPRRLRLLAEDRLPPAEVVGAGRAPGALRRVPRGPRRPGRRRALDRRGPPLPRARSDRALRIGAGPSSGIDETARFLAPSDWPDSLGRLGSYEVKGVIGRGGMGVVLKAFDPALNRNVAIKVLSPHLATCGAARRRFPREARAAAAVVHEHVVSVFAVVETAGLPFMVMEYVPGRRSRTGSTSTGRWRCRRSCGSACRRPPAWPPRMPRAWSTATSSRPTSCWRTASSGSS